MNTRMYVDAVEDYARRGMLDSVIALRLGMGWQAFGKLKADYPAIAEAAKRGRAEFEKETQAKRERGESGMMDEPYFADWFNRTAYKLAVDGLTDDAIADAMNVSADEFKQYVEKYGKLRNCLHNARQVFNSPRNQRKVARRLKRMQKVNSECPMLRQETPIITRSTSI